MNAQWKKVVFCTLTVWLTLLTPLSLHAAPPVLPSSFWGRVSVGTENVEPGTMVSVWQNNVLLVEVPAQIYQGNSVYAVTVPGDDPDTPGVEGGVEGGTLVFKVNGQTTQQTGIWHSGTSIELDLTVPRVPILLPLTPDSGSAGSTLEVLINGANTNFVAGATTADFGAGIAVNNLSVASATEATANLTINANAAPGVRTVTLTTSGEVVTLDGGFTVNGPGVSVELPSTTATADAHLAIPINLPNDVSGQNIISTEFDLSYDAAVLLATGVSIDSTLASEWTVSENIDVPGRVSVAAYNATPLAGSGVLLYLLFDVIGPVGTASDLTVTRFVFNEETPGATVQNGHITIQGLRISGRVTYRSGNTPVPNVTMELSGPAGHGATTDGDGNFEATADTTDTYTLTPSKQGDQRDAITALDAAWIAQCVVAKRALTDCPLQISDVSGDGRLMAYDAALVARFVVGIVDPSARTGQWHFDPSYRTYQPLAGDMVDQNFGAMLLGDVTGNWTEGVVVQAAQADGAVSLVVPALRAKAGGTLTVPLRIEGVAEREILAYEMTLHFDPTVLDLQSITQHSGLKQGWNMVYNASEPGVIRVAGYGVDPLTTDTVLLEAVFAVAEQVVGDTILQVSTARFNEDPPTEPTDRGVFTIDQVYRLHLPRTQR